MTCPKCRARIGVVREVTNLHNGRFTYTSCRICGYWVREFSATPQGDGLPGSNCAGS